MTTYNITFTEEELTLISNTLKWRSCYKPYGEVLGHMIWKPYMETMLQKIDNALKSHD